MVRDHECPRKGCSVRVPNTQFACLEDWRALSAKTQSQIWATASKNLLDPKRRAAITAAGEEWEVQ